MYRIEVDCADDELLAEIAEKYHVIITEVALANSNVQSTQEIRGEHENIVACLKDQWGDDDGYLASCIEEVS